MSRSTFHILLPIVTLAFVIPVVGGPWWGYPVALAAAFLATCFIAAYPSDTSLRWMLAGFGVFLLLPPLTHLWANGACWYVIREAAFTLLLGLACIWSAAFPVSEAGSMEKRSCNEATDLYEDSVDDQGSR